MRSGRAALLAATVSLGVAIVVIGLWSSEPRIPGIATHESRATQSSVVQRFQVPPVPGGSRDATRPAASEASSPGNPHEAAIAAFDGWLRRRQDEPTSRSEPEGIALAASRRGEFLELMKSDPRRALEVAIPDRLRLGLPAHVSELLEERVSGRGDLDVLCVERGTDGREAAPIQRFVFLGGRRYDAFVYGRRLGEPTRLGAWLYGIALDEVMAVEESAVRLLDHAAAESALRENPGALCPVGENHPAAGPDTVAVEDRGTVLLTCSARHAAQYGESVTGSDGVAGYPVAATAQGMKRLLFIRVDFDDCPGEPVATNRVVELAQMVNSFYMEGSYGRAGFQAVGAGSAVTPVLRMPRSAGSYALGNDPFSLRSDARVAARQAGYSDEVFDFDVVCMGLVPGFNWVGLGFIGFPGAWIRAMYTPGVLAHELGHNLGLQHANLWDTSGNSIIGSGRSVEYGDCFDTMGAADGGVHQFNARSKRLLGWLQDDEFTVVTTNGVYRIAALDQAGDGHQSRGLQIFASAGTNYWLEFRQRFTANPSLMNGAMLRRMGRGSSPTLLLDTTPGSASGAADAALVIGRTFSDRNAGVHITPVACGSGYPGWLDVVIHRGEFAGNHPPTVVLRTGRTEGAPGTAFNFHVEAQDPDGDELAYFWDFDDATLGENAPTTTHSWSADGNRRVQCTVSDMKGGVARASGVVRVGTPSLACIWGRLSGEIQPDEILIASSGGRRTYCDTDGTYVLTDLLAGSCSLSATTAAGVAMNPVGFTNPVGISGGDVGPLNFAPAQAAATHRVQLIGTRSRWKYWDRREYPGTGWKGPDFDDSGWSEGEGVFGYGFDGLATLLDFGSDVYNKPASACFRRQFVVDAPGQLTNVLLDFQRDDGAVVYLNGREVFRDNLPSGEITWESFARAAVTGTSLPAFRRRSVDAGLVVPGTNVVSVEMHQASATSSDLCFDLGLTADVIPNTAGLVLHHPSADESWTAPADVLISVCVASLPADPFQHIEFYGDGFLVGTQNSQPYTRVWREVPAGTHTVEARGVFANGDTRTTGPVSIQVDDPGLSPVFVPSGSRWRYQDGGMEPARDWPQGSFDDSAWKEGPARLGYGEDGEFTRIDYGPDPANKPMTTWFRRAFDVMEPGHVTNLVCRIQADDGAIVYLNGQEIVRVGMPDGAVDAWTPASTDISGGEEQAFTEVPIDSGRLVDGRNVLAVEVHQSSEFSDDLAFDLSLRGQRSIAPILPRLRMKASPGRLLLSWPATFTGWRLEATPTPNLPSSWQAIPGEPLSVGFNCEQTASCSGQPVFFRLARRTPR